MTSETAPRTTTLLRAQHVSAGIAIEVEDRGLGMLPADQQRMNAVLADPARIDIDELLRDGRIGLYVVSTLARRHGIRVQLQNNIYGGTQAVVVLPNVLLERTDSDRELPRPGFAANREPEPGLALARASSSPGNPAVSAGRMASGSWAAASDGAVPGEQFAGPPAAALAQRPPLPKRRAQASLAPQLRDSRRDDSARHAEPAADQMTGLMADFLRGISRSGEEDSPAKD